MPPRIPDDNTPPAVPRPNRKGRENTDLGGFGAPPPRFLQAGGRYDLLEQKLKQGQKPPPERSISPLPGPAAVPTVEDAGVQSFRPGRELVATAIRRVDPRWLGVALVLTVVIWALGGPAGIRELIAAWRASQFTNEIAALDKRISELETRAGNIEAGIGRRDKSDVKFRSDTSQVFGRLGVRWLLPDSTPAQRQLEFVTPLRQPGQVKGGPSVVVVQPIPLPDSPP